MHRQENRSLMPRNHSLPLLLKREASWEGISLAHYRMARGYLPEHQNKDHLITVALAENCHGEIRTPGGFSARDRNKGSVCVIPSGHPFAVEIGAESEHLAMLLDPSLVLRAAAEFSTPIHAEVVETAAPNDPVIMSVGLALMAELETEKESGRMYAESLANILALHLLRHYTASAHGGQRFVGGLSGKKLRLVLDFIDANYASDLGLSELATVAGMSTFHFAREFKRTTGATPHQYLIKLRIERAKTLLSGSEMSLVDVGFKAGFSHQSHFTRLFRKLTGTTPQSYRLMFQT
jgi:AraC family transcriptional regulator